MEKYERKGRMREGSRDHSGLSEIFKLKVKVSGTCVMAKESVFENRYIKEKKSLSF